MEIFVSLFSSFTSLLCVVMLIRGNPSCLSCLYVVHICTVYALISRLLLDNFLNLLDAGVCSTVILTFIQRSSYAWTLNQALRCFRSLVLLSFWNTPPCLQWVYDVTMPLYVQTFMQMLFYICIFRFIEQLQRFQRFFQLKTLANSATSEAVECSHENLQVHLWMFLYSFRCIELYCHNGYDKFCYGESWCVLC
jgi:hypothetical protein